MNLLPTVQLVELPLASIRGFKDEHPALAARRTSVAVAELKEIAVSQYGVFSEEKDSGLMDMRSYPTAFGLLITVVIGTRSNLFTVMDLDTPIQP